MKFKSFHPSLLSLLMAVSAVAQATNQTDRLHEFKKRAAKFNSVVTLPQFEMTTNEVQAAVRQTMGVENASLDRIGALPPRKVTFQNTVEALDDIGFRISLTANRLTIIKETSTTAALRETATDAIKELQEWMVGL